MIKLGTSLWFDSEAEDAAKFYTSIFKEGKIKQTSHYTKAGFEIHQRPEGSVMTVEFEIMGRPFIAINGGPIFKFSEAISMVVECDTQEEIDYYWEKLTNGGEEGPCGWLKDRFGLSWQVSPSVLPEMLTSSDLKKVEAVTNAYMKMKKFDIKELKRVFSQA